jgi:hypothetical protein
MGDFQKLKRPWTWLTVVMLSCAVGILAALLGLATVFLWQDAVYPASNARRDEFLSDGYFLSWVKYWVCRIIWCGLYMLSIGFGLLAGEKSYEYAVDRWDLRRWRDDARP